MDERRMIEPGSRSPGVTGDGSPCRVLLGVAFAVMRGRALVLAEPPAGAPEA